MRKFSYFLIIFILPILLNSTQITVYNNNFALIKRSLMIELVEGVNHYTVDDIPETIDPSSVIFKSSIESIEIISQNFEYTFDKYCTALEKSLGDQIEILTESGNRLKGIFKFLEPETIGLIEKKGKLVLVNRNDVLSVITDTPVEEFSTRPILDFEIYSEFAGNFAFDISYLCREINWNASYNIVWDEKEMLLEITPWINLDNRCGSSFDEVQLKLVAGDLNSIYKPSYTNRQDNNYKGTLTGSPVTEISEEILHDYHVYSIINHVSLDNNLLKQIRLFKPVSISAEKRYEYITYGDEVAGKIHFRYSKESGMATNLPEGIAKIYIKDAAGNLEFIGQDRIDHTGIDGEISLTTGYANNIFAETKVVDHRKDAKRNVEKDIEVLLRNRTESTCIIAVDHRMSGYWKILNSSENYSKISSKKIEFVNSINPGEDLLLQWTEKIEN